MNRTIRTLQFGVSFAVAIASFGCVGGSKGLSSEDKEKLKAYILDAPPSDIPHKIDINFENRVHLIGYNFNPETAKPGTDVKVTYWWRCDETLDDGWQLFTHVRDDSADKSGNFDNDGPLRETRNNRQLLGPDRWQKGKVYVDEQTIRAPEGTTGPDFSVLVGVWKGAARLRIVTGPNDGDNRAIVGKIKTGLAPAPEAHTSNDVPLMNVKRLMPGEKIVIDGKGDDKAWGGAVGTGPFVDVGTGKPNVSFPVNGSAKVAFDDANLYVLFDVTSPEIVGGFTSATAQKDAFTAQGQPKLWTKDTVEIMIEPDAEGVNKDYYEIQINPQNKVFHSQYDGYNTPKTEPNGPFGHEDWDPKLKSAVIVKGTLDKAGDKDEGYTVEAAIPWSSLTKAAHHPPKDGETWRMNFYAMKNNGGVAWSPILGQGNFHKASRFGKVVWGNAPVAAASPHAEVVAADTGRSDGGMIASPQLMQGGPRHMPAGLRGKLPPK